MGASTSVQVPDDDDEEEEDEEPDDHIQNERRELSDDNLIKKILQQEPEMLPCHASASPLSPQLSSFGTPRLGPSIKVWDPYNVLAPPPPPPPPPQFNRSFSLEGMEDDRTFTEVYLVCHGESQLNLRPDLIGGRNNETALTTNGKRQARALAVFLKSQGVRFTAVYTSPLDRARATALSVCQEMNFSEEQIKSADALLEMSEGDWEGCHRSDTYTPEMLSVIERLQPDFSAPSGESLRQVEFRMVQFLNETVMGLPEKLRSDFSTQDHNKSQAYLHSNSNVQSNSIHDREGPSLPAQWDLLHRHRQGLPRKSSGKSRLQFVTTTGDHGTDDEMSHQEHSTQVSLHETNLGSTSSIVSSFIGVFTHSQPIKCLLTGLLGCSPVVSHKICIDDSSVTVLQHSWKMGWQIKRSNDTSHLRLL